MQTNNQNQNQYRIRINHQIRASQVRLIDSDGSNIGIVSLSEALKKAKEQNLDLIEINPKAVPIIVKIVDYGKFKYEEKKKQSEAKKNQKVQELKELAFRPNTDSNDILIKLNQAKQFLLEGHKVKLVCKFKGREMAHPEIGREKFEWMFEELNDLIQSVPPINMEGKFMNAVVYPAKK